MRFSMLGNMTVSPADGEIILVRRRKHRQLLATLLLSADVPVPGHRLTQALWDDAPPPSADRNLKTYIYALRRLLSPEAPRSAPIKTHGTGYLIELHGGELDLLTFRDHVRRGRRAARDDSAETACHHLEYALDLWRGEPLQDARGSLWLDEAARRLAEERLGAVEELVELQLGMGRHVEAVARLRPEAAAHPLNERLWGRLMHALHLSGDRPAALRAYEQLRKTLAEEAGLDPGEAIRELHRSILAAGSTNSAAHVPGGSTNSATSVPSGSAVPVPDPAGPPSPDGAAPPRQLPRDLTGFVGRVEELVRLRSLLAPWDGARPHHVVAITGAPGSGKSALAVRAAHAVAGFFPGGQLYANLHGATPGIRRLEPLDVLGRFLRDLGTPPHAVPDDVDQAAAMWRSLLHGRQTLVVLDDAADLAQIRPLLSVPEGNAILATSRESFALVDDCVRMRIGRLRRAEAAAMFAKLVGAERAAMDARATGRLLDLCGGLPLAVGIVGARLANRPGWAVSALVERLEDERRRLHELEAGDVAVRSSLAVSYDLLSGGTSLDRTAARALRLIGMLEVPDVTPYVVAALLDGPVELAERALERLVDAHLVECDEPGRYRLHDLVRLFAREQAIQEDPESRLGGLGRALEAYTATARTAMKLSGQQRSITVPELEIGAAPAPLSSGEQAYEWLKRERANLLSAASQGIASSEEKAVRLGFTLALEIFWHLHSAGSRADLLTIAHQLAATGELMGDREVESIGRYHLAIAFVLSYRHSDAALHFEKLLALSRELSDPHGEQRALGGLAHTHIAMSRYQEAIRYAEAQQDTCRLLGYRVGEQYAMSMIGWAYQGLGELDQARTVLERALTEYRESTTVTQEGWLFETLGDVHLELEDPVSAKTCYERGLTIVRAAKMPVAEPHFLLGLARSCRLLGELDRTADYLAQTLALSRATGNDVVEQEALEEEKAVLAARGT
ncbi:AfsR/SARP family transcriptional regulator [Planobispora rosea]|uniref:AfsR/SARP family transcriptional regulator n=1 Tax=Planobispora rosea TaxID=35762 RepID=UPI00114C9EA1|nr:AfsR/SARP family transcriptional regulator [Planobispora rosea]